DLEKAFKAHADASREYIALLDKIPDEAQTRALEAKVVAAREKMDTAELVVEHHCQDRADDCTSFAPALKAQPDANNIDANDAAKTKEWAASVDKWANELAKAEVKEEQLKTELAGLQQGMKDMAAILVQLSALTADAPKREQAQDAVDKRAQDIGAAVDE